MARRITHIRKRDDRVMPFDQTKIADAIWKAAQAGDWQAVRAGQARINRLHAIIRYGGSSVAAVKAAAGLAGRGSRWLRQRSLSLSDEQVEHIGGMLREFDAREGREA